MKKRIVSALLVAAMAASTFAGCGSTSGSASSAGTEGADAADSQEIVEIALQLPIVGDAPAGLEDVEAAVNEITEAEVGVHVTLLPTDAFNLQTETSLAVSSGDQLDLCLSLFSGISALVDQGLVIEMSDLLESNGQDILSTCGESIYGGTANGGQYAVPTAYVNGNNIAFVAVKEDLDAAGITIDESKFYSMDEIEEIFDAVMATKGDGYHILGGGYNTDLPWGAFYTAESFGYGVGLMYDSDFNTDNTVVSIYESDEYAEYAQKMYEWAQKGYFSSDAATTDEMASTQMANGTALGLFANDSGVTASDYYTYVGKECVCIQTNPAYIYTSAFQSVLWSITSSCQNPEKAMDLLNLMYTNADLDNLLMYGIEGVSYDITEQDEHGTVITMKADAPYQIQFGVFGDRFLWDVLAPGTTTTNEELQAFSDAIDRSSPALGFSADFSSVSTEVSNINSKIEQYRATINTGSVDPAESLPAFIADLKAAGIDTVVETVSQQYEDWKAAQ